MATVTVTDLMLNFAQACRAIVPALERAGVPWRDGEQYDNWDHVAEALFKSLVAEPCSYQAVNGAGLAQLRVARYGFAPDANSNAWIAVSGERPAPIMSLASVSSPFDHVRCVEPPSLVPLVGTHFVFVANDGTQQVEKVDLAAE